MLLKRFYDEGLAQVKTNDEPFPNYSREENRGKDLFLRRCANCLGRPRC